MIVLYGLTVMVIAAKGYFNARYKITLLPISIGFLMWQLWDWLGSKPGPRLRVAVLGFLIIAGLGNNTVFFIGNFFENDVNGREDREALPERLNVSERVRAVLASTYNRAQEKVDNHLDFDVKDRGPAYDILQYVDSIETPGYILVNNLPMVYYYTNKQGVWYWCGNDLYSVEAGEFTLLRERTLEESRAFVRDSLGCSHVFSFHKYDLYNEKFHEFVTTQCDEEYRDRSGFVLYRVKD